MTVLFEQYIYKMKNQNNFLKQLLDLLKVKPKRINQNVLPIILCQIQMILPLLHNRTHSKVEAWGRWPARPKICLIVTISLQQSG